MNTPTPDQIELEKFIRGLGENPALKSEAHEEVIQEALAAISKLMVAERIDELQHVDRHTTYYPDGSEPIEAQERITELKAELRKGI